MTYEQRVLLQRLQDGDLSTAQEAEARALLQESEEAVAFVDSLEEVHVATCAAEQEAWERVDAPAANAVAAPALAGERSPMGLPLEDLIGLLDRFHDGEATAEEMDEVELLLEAREDVAEYLLGMTELGEVFERGHQEEVAEVDFGGFWDSLSARLEQEEQASPAAEVVAFPGAPKKKKSTTAERPAFTQDDHQVLLYRYHDGEVSEQERAQVMAWAEIDGEIAETLGALEELSLAATVAMEQAQERVDLSVVWAGVSAELADEFGGKAPVISLEQKRAEKEEEKPKETGSTHRREAFIALAAVLVTVLGMGLFGDKIFGTRVVEKTVVIVDSVEYGDGKSVIVTGPMQQASMTTESEEDVDGAEDAEPEAPTVIWLIDPNEVSEEEGDGAADASDDAGAKPSKEAPEDGSKSEEKKPDWQKNPI
ncbi:MAG: hypothetical protein VX475_19665 [Myxococcota bacterium]|nr:hypothetical protein [Myxococcota bacterium]